MTKYALGPLALLLVVLAACGAPATAPTQSTQALPTSTSPSQALPTNEPASPAPAQPSTTPLPTPTNSVTPTAAPSNTPAPPTRTPTPVPPQTIQHAISVVTARDIYHIHLTAAGEIKVRATWTGSQSSLALIINGPGQVNFFARKDGASPLEISYTVTAQNFQAGADWTVSVASFGAGQASGTVHITYPSASSQSPFDDDFSISNAGGRIIQVLVLKHAGPIQAQATWTGKPSSLALILNGPGQVSFFARHDGPSPLDVSYTVTAANMASGDTWRLSLAAFSAPNANGTLKVTFP